MSKTQKTQKASKPNNANLEAARAKAAAMRAEAAEKRARRRRLTITAAVAAAAVLIVAIAVIVQVARANQAQRAVASSSTPAHVSDGGITVGDESAKVTLEFYEDFQCPVCRQFEAANATQLSAWLKAGKVKIVYRPISFLDRASTTDYSSRALNAAAVVVDTAPAAFPAFHDLLYANQPAEGSAGLPDSTLIDLAVQAGADRAAIDGPITHRRFAGWVTGVTDASSKRGVTGTPTVYLNGTPLKEVDPRSLAAAVNKAAG